MDFVLKYYRGNVFKKWCLSLLQSGYKHGNDLVLLLGEPLDNKPGLTDNVYATERLLNSAVENNWIIKDEKPKPSIEQQFFGIGGIDQQSRGWNKPEHMSIATYWFKPNRDSKEFMNWVENV